MAKAIAIRINDRTTKKHYSHVAAIQYSDGSHYRLCDAISEKSALEIGEAWIAARLKDDSFGLNAILLRD